MPQLQKINLGTPPAGVDGDTVRSALAKVNANTDVLTACVALGYAILADSTTLEPGQVGAHFGVNCADLGKVIKLPLASSVSINACVHIFNVAQPVTVGMQGNNGTQVTVLNRGDWVKYISDGVTYWHVAARGRMLWDETVGGSLTVGGGVTVNLDATVKGNLRVGGNAEINNDVTVNKSLTISGRLFVPEGTDKAPGIAFLNDGAPDTGFFHISDGTFGVTCNTQEIVRYGPGFATYKVRPTFGGRVPWDTGNFDPGKYAQLSGAEFAGGVSIKSDSGAHFKGTSTALTGTSNGAVNDGTMFNSVHGPLDRQAFFTFREYYNQSANALIAVRAGTDWRNFHFRMDGNGYCQGNWVNGSDERVKSNIEPIEDALSKMRSIRGCTWDRLDGVSCGIGFIAQEVQKVFPEHVRVAEPTRTLDDGTTIKDFLSIDTGGIAAALHHQAILELMDEMESMRSRIKELESKVSA
ncbi:tail fiber domain-containing protein [Burkholderia aenigmatica]|uniref:Peptidase S74 domain-containing protein n=1 Tax=Burkholderia aenigmatica TaxID=2015348 RepID=A0A228HHB1_9BURK|nr:tail fiber domain-containing protein [Burkholderia aenigmatica]OXI29600.1 hypothetical protein CFB84_43615 [Burkholderia aenigmatica]